MPAVKAFPALRFDKHETINYKGNIYFRHVAFRTELVKLREVTRRYLVIATDAHSNFLSPNAVSPKFLQARKSIVPTEPHI